MAVHPFSPAGRASALAQMAETLVDLLVIGGGITGAGLAREAALRGLSVALVERDDFGAGTSSRSAKLIHGGIRYLAQGDLAMVRESARERQVLRQIAPHLVHPLPFYFPHRPGESPLKMRLALTLFDLLAGCRGERAHRSLNQSQAAGQLPGLAATMAGALVYEEFVTDDARFTMENALCAALHGALVANHTAVTGLLTTPGPDQIAGAKVVDRLTGAAFDLRARVVVNCTGPWAAATLRAAGLTPPRPLLPSKGIHLLFRADRLPVAGAVALRDRDGRTGFAIRRWAYVYAGTTDEPHQGGLDQPVADAPAVDLVLRLVQDSFPHLELTRADILATWAGLRPLIAEPGRTTRETSRHDEIWAGPPGLLTVAGGKLTTYRAMAGRILAQVARLLRRPLADGSLSARTPLPYAGTAGQATDQQQIARSLQARGVSPQAAERITWLYGAAAARLLAMGDEDPGWLEPLGLGSTAIRGEVRLAVEQEMALTLPDFMDRRSALLLFSDDRGLGAAAEAARLMAHLLGWTETERRAQLERYQALADRHAPP